MCHTSFSLYSIRNSQCERVQNFTHLEEHWLSLITCHKLKNHSINIIYVLVVVVRNKIFFKILYSWYNYIMFCLYIIYKELNICRKKSGWINKTWFLYWLLSNINVFLIKFVVWSSYFIYISWGDSSIFNPMGYVVSFFIFCGSLFFFFLFIYLFYFLEYDSYMHFFAC